MKPFKQPILVTAANSEIASAFIRQIHNEDFPIIITTFKNTGNLPQLSDNIIHLQNIDLTKEGDIKKLELAISEKFTAPFSWLHCAGDFWSHKKIEDTPLSEAINMINSHYISLYATSKVVLPVMKDVGGGRIITFSCNSVSHNYPEMTAFTPAKAAIESLVKCLSNEVLEHKILMNCLALPTVRTSQVKDMKLEKYHQYYPSMPSIVEAVINCFDSMSGLITGNVLRIVKHSPYFYTEGYYDRNEAKET